MFRRLAKSLPKDPSFPADFEKLGYFITPDDQIRSISHPDREFHYFISKNDRVLVTQREAFNICIRRELASRFPTVGLETTRLPPDSGLDDPHVPILTTPNLATASRILLFFGGDRQDLGVLAYRTIGGETVNAGSVMDFAKTIRSGPQGPNTAIVIANLGQLVWYRRGRQAMTPLTWDALPRPTGVAGPMRLDPVKNSVEGHRTREEHVASAMEFVQTRAKAADVMIDVVGTEEGAGCISRFLDREWESWKGKVRAICLGMGSKWYIHDEMKNEDFKLFWSKRARIYFVHHAPTGTPLHGREDTGCNCYSSGEDRETECIVPKAHGAMLEYFDLVNDLPGYEEVEDLEVLPKKKGEEGDEGEDGEVDDDDDRVVRWVDARDEK